jgi:pilus assembly protein Flp/PilA
MTKMLSSIRKDTVGATAIEYGLIAAAIAVVIIAVLSLLGGNVSNTFQTVANAV